MTKNSVLKKRIFPLILSLSFLLVSCGGGGGSTVGNSLLTGDDSFSSAEKEFVYTLFNTEYLWFDEVDSNVDYNAFDTPQALIDGLRVPQDKWSFSMTQKEYEDYSNQKTTGFGFGYTVDFTIYMVRIDAPAWNKLLRGDKILEINGESATKENIAEASQNLNVATTFTVLRAGTEVNVVLSSQEYTFKVTAGKTFTQGAEKVGYLRYDSFTGTSVSEFEAAFTQFKADAIQELIVDLRYNGGGSIDTASVLLENFTNQYPGKRQVYLDWNVNYQSRNSSYYFSDEVENNDLDMKRVIFLVTKNSASASELVISALKPYLGDSQVVTIGDVTHGKPVGMNGRTYGVNYYFLINFIVKNDKGETTDLDGIPVTCLAEDDLNHLRGDPEETMLKTALYYIATDNCLN
jgi:hypothetical protein